MSKLDRASVLYHLSEMAGTVMIESITSAIALYDVMSEQERRDILEPSTNVRGDVRAAKVLLLGVHDPAGGGTLVSDMFLHESALESLRQLRRVKAARAVQHLDSHVAVKRELKSGEAGEGLRSLPDVVLKRVFAELEPEVIKEAESCDPAQKISISIAAGDLLAMRRLWG